MLPFAATTTLALVHRWAPASALPAPRPPLTMAEHARFPTREAVLGASLPAIFSSTTEFKEAGREFRQDVYSYNDWRWHRESGHIASAISSVFTSGVGKAMWRETFFVIATAAAVYLYNIGVPVLAAKTAASLPIVAALLGRLPLLHLSLLPLTLSSPALFLLLVFRTNNSYDRWWEARKVWGGVINASRDLARQALALVRDAELKKLMVSQIASYARVLKYHLGPPTPEARDLLRNELVDNRLPADQVRVIMEAKHKPMALLGLVSASLHDSGRTGLDTVQASKLDQTLSLLTDYLGKCERIVKTPLPLVYTRHTARFLSWWLLFLPVCLYNQLRANWMIVPVSGLIGFFLVGIEDLGNQIEEPFSILPLTAMGTGIQQSIFEALDRSEGVAAGHAGSPGDDYVPYIKMSNNPNAFVR